MSSEAQTAVLAAQLRTSDESAATLRKQGFVPIELYGKHTDNKQLKVSAVAFSKIFEKAGESTLIDLMVGDTSDGKVLIKDIQFDPVKDAIIHADLYQIDMNETLHTEIPLVFIGESPAVKQQGGTLVKQVDKIEIKCLPGDLIHDIQVDISVLQEFTDSIQVENLTVPETIEVLTDPTVLIVSVAEPRKVEEAAAQPAEGTEAQAEKESEEAEANNQAEESKE